MSDRTYTQQYTNCLEAVQFNLRFIGAGAAAVPTFVEGDGQFVVSSGSGIANATGTEWTMTRSSTGVLSLVSVNPWAGVYSADGGLFLAAADSTNTSGVQFTALPSQNSTTNVWTFAIGIYVAATLTDLASTQSMWIQIVMRNQIGGP